MSVSTLFRGSRPVAIPTETVYGLAAPVDREEVVREIFRLKERPFFDPLIVHVSSVAMAQDYTLPWGPVAQKLAHHFWPGPLTLVLPKKENISDIITSGLDTVGVRMPNHPKALEVIRNLGTPLAAPSANKFSCVSPTEAIHVRDAFGDAVDLVDGGPCGIGIESTIVRPGEGRLDILRFGALGAQELRKVLGDIPVVKVESSRAPGQFDKHYTPAYPLVTALRAVGEEERIVLREKLGVSGFEERHLGEEAFLAARELYGLLRRPLGQQGRAVVLRVRPRESISLWEAILDRLKRASVCYLD